MSPSLEVGRSSVLKLGTHGHMWVDDVIENSTCELNFIKIISLHS